VVRVAGEQVALPTEAVLMALAADQGERTPGRLRHLSHDVVRADLAEWLGLARPAELAVAARPAVLLTVRGEVMALEVDAVLDARDLILQDVGQLLRRLPGVGGGALRPDGQVLFVLDVDRIGLARGSQIDRDAALQLRRRTQVQRKRVLVVDDSLSVRKALSQLLGDAGYEVEVARDGFEALDAMGTAAHDIVLTDLEMPNLNGLDLTRRLRQDSATHALPVILITSRSSDKHREAAEQAGVSDYLTKPYTDADLLKRVRDLVGA
jgi:chemosensory pili system protein ChpA (sensor histidine kinase/response regulator)